MYYTDLVGEKKILTRTGWSKSKLDLFMGKPDKVIPKISKAGVTTNARFWSVQRVEFVESTKEFMSVV
jgi:hypothetical protein